MLSPGDTVICAVSGGADSLCLLRLLTDLSEQYERPAQECDSGPIGACKETCLSTDVRTVHVQAVHVHHGIRGESADRDAAYVKRICDEWGVPVVVRYVDVPAFAKKERIGLEEAARKLRYQVLIEEANKIKIEKANRLTEINENPIDETIHTETGEVRIAVAHNKDDNAETLLMHLCRGAGLSGLSGIAPVKEILVEACLLTNQNTEAKELHIIRPLLNTSRAEIESYLRERDISWCTDETNADTAYTRNAVRNELLPYLAGHVNARAKEHIAEAAVYLREVSDYLEKQTERVYGDCVTEDFAIDLKRLRKEDELIQTEVLKKAYAEASKKVCDDTDKEAVNHEDKTSCAGGSAFREQKCLERSHLESLRQLISSSDGTVTICLPGGIRAERRYGKLFFHTQLSAAKGIDTKQAAGGIRIPSEINEHIVTRLDTGVVLEAILLQFTNARRPVSDLTDEGKNYVDPLVWEVKDAFLPSYTNRLDYDKINEVLCAEKTDLSFRKRAAGDRILIAEARHKTLKKYMIDDKIPECARDSLYVLTAGARVLWVPGFYTEPGLMASKDSKRVLELRYVRHGVFCRDTYQK